VRRSPESADPVASLSYCSRHLRAFEGSWSSKTFTTPGLPTRAAPPCSCSWFRHQGGVPRLIPRGPRASCPSVSWVTLRHRRHAGRGAQLAFTFDELGSLAEALEARSADLQSIITLTNGWPGRDLRADDCARGSGESVEMPRAKYVRLLAEQVLADCRRWTWTS